MIRKVNNCVDCGLPCIGTSCRYKNELEIICDRCGDECYEAYDVNDETLCESCLLETFPKITSDNAEDYFDDGI